MCWLGNQTEPLIAETDIRVKKVLKKVINRRTGQLLKITSPFLGFEYKLGILYESDIKLVILRGLYGICGIKINKGLHSYREGVLFIRNKIDNGIRVKSTPQSAQMSLQYYQCDCEIYDAIIPAGSEYYENSFGELVSNKIIIKKEYTDVLVI